MLPSRPGLLVIGQIIILLLSDSVITKAGRFFVVDVSEKGKGTDIRRSLCLHFLNQIL